MAPSIRSEAIHTVQKAWFINGFQHFLKSKLYHLVFKRCNAQRSHLAVTLRDIYPLGWQGVVCLILQPSNKVFDFVVQLLAILFLGHFIDSHCLLSVNLFKALLQKVSINHMIQTRKDWLSCLRWYFCYSFQFRCHHFLRPWVRMMCPQKDRYYVAPFPPSELPDFISTMKLSDCLQFIWYPSSYVGISYSYTRNCRLSPVDV